METALKKIIEERWDQLPLELKDLFSKKSYTVPVANISNYYKLTPTQSSRLLQEIFFVIFGFEAYADLTKNLKVSLNLSQEVAEKITFELEKYLFYVHSDILNKMSSAPDFISFRTALTEPLESDQMGELGLQDTIYLKEELKLRPDASEVRPEMVRPLTREDIASALASKRTMNSDIEALHEHTDDTQK